ncbi:hypothetical protein [Streptomyces sp. enrichment culture]|uniref:hypothetical protein n=1 Tax=Streptomyces sp. enrichment culture TaxID=1795815 RepID=UPI003F565299
MFKSIKITAVAGVLAGSALVGLGAVQAAAAENPGKCTNDGRGHVRCVDAREDRITGEKAAPVQLVDGMRRECSGGGAVSCAAGALVGDKKS